MNGYKFDNNLQIAYEKQTLPALRNMYFQNVNNIVYLLLHYLNLHAYPGAFIYGVQDGQTARIY